MTQTMTCIVTLRARPKRFSRRNHWELEALVVDAYGEHLVARSGPFTTRRLKHSGPDERDRVAADPEAGRALAVLAADLTAQGWTQQGEEGFLFPRFRREAPTDRWAMGQVQRMTER